MFKKSDSSRPATTRRPRAGAGSYRRPQAPPPPDPSRGGTPSALGDVLSKLARRSGLREHFDQARVWEAWPEIVGAKLAAHGQPKFFKQKVLHIEVGSAVWMSRYSYMKWDLVKRVNLLVGYELISDVFFVLKDDEAPR